MLISAGDARVVPLRAAIAAGDVVALRAVLATDPDLATAYFGSEGNARNALLLVTDYPGHLPRCGQTIAALVAAGADVDAPSVGEHPETPLHWAASCDDVEAIDALIAAGANIESTGGALTGGPPLDDAVVFGQFLAGRRLVDHGATTQLFHAAALGMTERVVELLADGPPAEEITNALWHGCNGGHADVAMLLLDAGADATWVGWNDATPPEAAEQAGFPDVAAVVRHRR
jgi:ankyrin repeat protein